jgi:hypothetical protein
MDGHRQEGGAVTGWLGRNPYHGKFLPGGSRASCGFRGLVSLFRVLTNSHAAICLGLEVHSQTHKLISAALTKALALGFDKAGASAAQCYS